MKKIICVFIALLMLASLFTVFASATVYDDTFALGDVNSDGAVNARDSLFVKKYTASGETDGVFITDAADITADGIVNARDNFYIKAILAGAANVSDYESENQIYKMEIAGVDVGSYVILYPDSATADDAVYTAARLLQRAIQAATGKYCDDVTSTECKNVIEFHVVEIGTEIDGIVIDSIEDYYYKVGDGRLDIYGTKYRGCIYASYEIIKEYLGFIYYSQKGAFIFKQRCVFMEEGTTSYHSMSDSFSYRYVLHDLFDVGSRAGADSYFLPALCNGQQIGAWSQDKYGTLTGPLGINAHSFESYAQMSTGREPTEEELAELVETEKNRYIKSGVEVDLDKITEHVTLKFKYDTGRNPNSKNDWQPCMTDGDTYDALYGGMLDYIRMLQTERTNYNILRTDLGNSFMSFSISDNSSYCTCKMCKAVRLGAKTRMAADQVANLPSWYGGEYEVSGNYVTFKRESDSGLSVNMANRAARDVQEYYPGLKIYMILYDHTVPETIRPDENIVIMYCGLGCNNHKLTETCTGTTFLGTTNETTKKDLATWCKIGDETGCLIYFWDYPIQNGYTLSDSPSILNIYYDYKWMYETGVDGIYFEGESSGTLKYSFENAKAYMATRMLWNPTMSYEEYTDILKEYLYVAYGNGYEEIYQYLLMDDESGNLNPCFVNNHDRPFDDHNAKYLCDNYETMRSLVTTALEKTKRKEQRIQCEYLLMITDFLGLSASYNKMYVNGDTASRALYEQRYTDMYNYMAENEIWLWDSDTVYTLPDELDFSENPVIQFYSIASWRWNNDCLNIQ